MAVIVVAGDAPEAGATTIAVGLAHRLAYAGHEVRVSRLEGDERAASDAAAFALLDFATSPGQPVAASGISAGGEGVAVIEAPAGSDAVAVARDLGATLVLVRAHDERGGAEDAPAAATVIATHAERGGALLIPEDRLLAAPTVGRIIEASRAQVLARSIEGDAALCEHIVAGPIAEDSDRPHFERFARKAVVTRSEKVDIALSALSTETRCLILTGGADPSPYLLDRVASGRSTTLLLARAGTAETLRNVEGIFGSSPFSGAEKVERIGQLMGEALTDEALAAVIGDP